MALLKLNQQTSLTEPFIFKKDFNRRWIAMNETNLMIDTIEETRKSGLRSALATVVSVRGSAYRREGAKMFIDENGNTIGTISGGCLESDVAEQAKMVMDTGLALLKTYELDEDLVWGLGLGCPGTVKIYIEPIDPLA